MMFVDVVELNFNNHGKLYHPGEELFFQIVVNSAFKVNCKSIKIRIIAPFQNQEKEYFRLYKFAKIKGRSLLQNGDKAMNFKLLKGRNKFIVKCTIPEVSERVFKEYRGVLRCSFKVTVKFNWFFKLNSMDWIVLQPASVAEGVVDKIDAGLNFMVNGMNFFHKKVKKLAK